MTRRRAQPTEATLVYVDTSVVLAALLGEPRRPDDGFWRDPGLFGSVLVEIEALTRLRAAGSPIEALAAARSLIGALTLLPLDDAALAAARRGFGPGLRTLDALHLSTALSVGARVTLATYDKRMRAAAESEGIAITHGF